MSERTEIVRLAFDAYRRGDLDVFADWMHPDIEIHDWPEAADPRVYHGINGIVEARDEWGKAWEYPIRLDKAPERASVYQFEPDMDTMSAIELFKERRLEVAS